MEEHDDRRQDAPAETALVWGYIHRRKTDMPQDNGGGQEHAGHKEEKSSETGDTQDAQQGNGKRPKKMSRQKKRLLIAAAIILAAVLLIAGILYFLHARRYESTDDAFIDGHVSQIAPQVSGRVQSLLVSDNEEVKAGQTLFEIDPRDYQVKLKQVEAQQEQAKAQVILQRANIGQARANVLVADAQAFQAHRDLMRFRGIDQKAITSQQLDSAVAAAKSADAKLEASRQAVEAAQGQMKVADAAVSQAQAEIENAQLQLSYTKVVAPVAGRVTRRMVELGNLVSPGQPGLALVSSDVWVTANFKETQLRHMRVGQPVDIAIDTYPNANLHGHVDSIQSGSGAAFSILPAENATGNYVKVVQRVPVKILFDNTDMRDKYPLSPGLSVQPRVKVR